MLFCDLALFSSLLGAKGEMMGEFLLVNEANGVEALIGLEEEDAGVDDD